MHSNALAVPRAQIDSRTALADAITLAQSHARSILPDSDVDQHTGSYRNAISPASLGDANTLAQPYARSRVPDLDQHPGSNRNDRALADEHGCSRRAA